jgi:Zn-dependent M28 family amino/carboxypeptidase
MILSLIASTLIALEPAKAVPDRVDADRLIAQIEALPTKRSGAGDAEHRAGLIKAQEQLTKLVTDMGFKPELTKVVWSRRTDADKPDWRNIVFEIPGKSRPGEVLLIGAHFDAVPNCPGADDNGTGVSALLEIARALKDEPMQRTVRFVLFNLEELGLIGSRQYVQQYFEDQRADKPKVIGMLSLEMLGYYSTVPGSQRLPFKVPGVDGSTLAGDFIGLATIAKFQPFSQALRSAMQASEPKAKLLVADFMPVAMPDLLRSDHAPFLLKGVPAVILADTADFRNPHYHKPSDTVDKLDKARYALTVRALAGAVHTLAGPVGKELVTWEIKADAPVLEPKPEAKPEPKPAQATP